jgi:hypothetical protein
MTTKASLEVVPSIADTSEVDETRHALRAAERRHLQECMQRHPAGARLGTATPSEGSKR